MEKIITITIPEEVRDEVQRYDMERSSRRDIIAYILSNNDISISDERFSAYQKEYDEKFMAFEKIKNDIEKQYIQPAANNKAINWSLNYQDCIATITVND